MGARWIRGVLTGIVLCLVAFLGYLLVIQLRSSQSPSASVTHSVLESADAGIQGFTYRQTQSGEVQWEVEARLAKVFESERQAFLEDVRIHLYREEGRDMTIEAERGTIHTDTNDLDLVNEHDPIVVTLASGYTILTKHLRWVHARQEFQTNALVEIKKEGLTITGIGLIGNLESEEVSILEDVHFDLTS